MATTACQPTGTNIFSAENIRNCERYVSSIQRKLDKAVADNDKSKIRWYTHLLSKRSRAVKILAVYHVTTQNQGRYTAGIDGIRMIRGRKGINEQLRLSLLNAINIKKKPSPIRRVFISKPNGKKRPLGIPTIADRIIQDILRMTLEPITEYHASDNSYGFRPKRSCHDTIEHLYRKLSRKTSRQWVIEGDIKGCFDNISQDHILNTLSTWHVANNITNIIRKMLKAKLFFEDVIHDVDTGTPQGGILSPMLANVALTALDEYCQREFGIVTPRPKRYGGGKYTQNPIVRYADDFTIICRSESEARDIKERIATFLEDSIGLELSEEKTKITHISEGFNFLGFNIRKYISKSPGSKYHQIGKLLIKPQKEKVTSFVRKIQVILNDSKTAKQASIIHMLNPMLRGFAMYYRFAVSKKAFSHIDHQVWKKLWHWAKRRHPNKFRVWIRRKYFTGTKRRWMFTSETGNAIIAISSIPITRFVKAKSGMRVYADDRETREYWKQRAYTNALGQVYSIKVERLMKRQEGICCCCNNPITKDDIADNKVHVHHMLPRSKDGTDELNNLRLLHQDCHILTHQVLSRDEMAYWMKKKLDYTLKSNIACSQASQGNTIAYALSG